MARKARLFTLLTVSIGVLALAFFSGYLESRISSLSAEMGKQNFWSSTALFYVVVNINVILLFVFLFLTFRNGVKLAVDRKRGTFGSSLRTKLVTSFLFFSLLPTVVLLYFSTKFMNANFEKWLPENLVTTSQSSVKSEKEYQNKIASLLRTVNLTEAPPSVFDFVLSEKGTLVHASNTARELGSDKIASLINENKNQISRESQWFSFDKSHMVAIVKDNSGKYFGVFSPDMIHPQWEFLGRELSDIQPGIRVLRISYYVMLGVVTLLIVFSATWLGFTIARELTIPLQVLASATELVSQGSYVVRIDDIISDDEIGKLARSFRSMVFDLHAAKEEADKASAEIQKKAEELLEKSEYNSVLLQNVNAAILSLDENGLLETCNDQAESLFHIREKDVLSRPLSEVVEKEFFETAIQPLLNEVGEFSLTEKKRAVGDFVGRVSGAECQLHIFVSELTTPRGREGTVIIIHDVTELAKAQHLAAWRDVARRVAHEIKNPLTPIKLGAQRLQKKFNGRFEGEDVRTFEETIKVILHSSESIKRLVDEFIRIARMPNPTLREGNILEPIQMAVASLAENPEKIPVRLVVLETDRILGIPFEHNLHALPVLRSRFDSDHIVRLFVNLISNALGASSQSSATEVVVQVLFAKEEKTFVTRVMDWGIGVPDDVRGKIFEPYFSTKRTGTGLGLVIVKQIVEEHRGVLTLEKNEPQGSIFSVRLPLA